MISASIDRKTRYAVYRRDHFRCALCDSPKYIQVHHAIPRGRGGDPRSMHNLITLCAACHAAVHGLDIEEFYWTPDTVEQACVEYLADLYAPDWWPWRSGYHPGGWNPRAGGG